MRLKIIGVCALVVLATGLVSWQLVRGPVRNQLRDQAQQALARQRDLFERAKRLASLDLLDRVQARTADSHVLAIFDERTPDGHPMSSDDRRRAGWGECDAFAARLEQPVTERGLGRKPEVVIITDGNGYAISRNLDPNGLLNVNLSAMYPAVQRALRGQSSRDVWLFRNGRETILMNVAVAPIRREGSIVGTLVTGYDLSAGEAADDSQRAGIDIAYFLDDRIYGSSLRGDWAAQLGRAIFGEHRHDIDAAVGPERTRSNLFALRLGDADFLATVGPLPQVPSGLRAGYVALTNLDEASAPGRRIDRVLWATLVGVLLAITLGLLLGTYLSRPLEQMEDVVLQVINGNLDQRIEIRSSEYGALAYRINQMIATLTGVDEAEEEGKKGEGEEEAGEDARRRPAPAPSGGISVDEQALMAPGVEDPAPSDAVIQSLAREDEGQYYPRIFREYVNARNQTGEGNENITQDRFIERLRESERTLAQKYGCPMVRFQVAVKNNRAVLRPIPIQY